MDTEYESSRIEKAKRNLYQGDAEGHNTGASADLSPLDIEVAHDWGDTTIVHDREKRTGGVKILKALVVLAVLVTFGSASFLLYNLFDPFAKPSDKNILIAFDVPVGATPGVPADILVRVSNQNRIALEYGNLTIVYPPGTRRGDTPEKDLHDEKKVLGQIGPGQVVEYHTKAIFLGEENTDKELHASLEYRFTSINSVFTKDEVRPVHLLAAPVNLTVDTLKEVNSGQEIELGINAASNTVIPLRDVLVKVEFPLGFTLTDSEPKPTFGNNIWRIGTMDPASKFKIRVRGILAGEDTQEKVFHTSVGAGSDQTERNISVMYSTQLSSMTVQRPFIGIALLLNGKSAEEATAHFGQRIAGEVQWLNNLPTKIINAQIEVKLSGVALDRTTVTTRNGFYRSSDDTIFWDERSYAQLAVLEAGDRGSVNFSFLPMPAISGTQLLTNPTITAEVTVRGKRISEAGVPEEVKTAITQNVKVTSQAQFTARGVYYSGPFVNTGPLPPKVEQETTYTVIWDIVNISNTINNPQVRAILPPYVTWAGAVYPNKENITYNQNTHQITWVPGDIPPGTGVGKPPREVSFQIILTPSLSQVASFPILLNHIHFDGTDSFTGESLSQDKEDITTKLITDPKAGKETYNVVP